MNLKKNWERLAFGTNSSGQISGLLKEFRDTSTQKQYDVDVDVEQMIDTGEITADERGTPEHVADVPTHGTLEGFDFFFEVSDLMEGGSIAENFVLNRRGNQI